MKKITVPITEDLHQAAKDTAKIQGRSLNELVRRALAAAIAAHEIRKTTYFALPNNPRIAEIRPAGDWSTIAEADSCGASPPAECIDALYRHIRQASDEIDRLIEDEDRGEGNE